MFTQVEKDLIQDAIDKINTIPSENIITTKFTDGESKCCVIGHLVRLGSENPENYSRINCVDWYPDTFDGHPIRKLSERFLKSKLDIFEYDCSIASVNNGECELYKQETPKERSLACLEDMLKTETVEVAEA